MAKYIYQEKGIEVGGKRLVYPRFAHIKKLDCKEFLAHAAHGRRDKEIALGAAIAELADELACALAEGHSVELEGIGLFTPTLRMKEGRQVVSEGEDGSVHKSNAQSVEFGTVNFVPARQLLSKCHANCQDLEHDGQSGDSLVKMDRTTPEQRLQFLQEYLEREGRITVSQYAQLTGISQTSASRELRKLYESTPPVICRVGKSPHMFYTKLP